MAAQEQKTPNKAEQAAKTVTSKKVGQAVSTKVVQSAAGKAIGSALGSLAGTVLPVVGNIVGGLVGGAVAGAATSAIKNAGKALATIPFALANLGMQAAGVVAGSIASALGIAFGLMFAGIVTLIFVVALILFIINSAAYVVPPGGSIAGGGSGTVTDIPFIGGSCPIPNGLLSCGSYGNPAGVACPANPNLDPPQPGGHGDNNYWAGKILCNFALPSTSADCYQNQIAGNVCSVDVATANGNINSGWTGESCPNYGWSADFTYSDLNQRSAQRNLPVYLPEIAGQEVEWTLNFVRFTSSTGGHGTLRTVVNGTVYEMYMAHLNSGGPVAGRSGGLAGTLYDAYYAPGRDGRHVHIEIKVNGQWIRPDALCSGDFGV